MSNAIEKCTTLFRRERFIIRMLYALIFILGIVLCVQTQGAYQRQLRTYHDETLDSAEEYLLSLSTTLDDEVDTAQGDMLSLVELIDFSLASHTGAALYESQIQTIVAKYPSYYLVRFVPKEGESYGAGPGTAIPSEDQPNSPFTALEGEATTLPDQEILASDLEEYTTPSGMIIPLVYAVMPVRQMIQGHEKTVGSLEVAFDMRQIFAQVQQAVAPEETIALLGSKGQYLVQAGSSTTHATSVFDVLPHTVTTQMFSSTTVNSFTYGSTIYTFYHLSIPNLTYSPKEFQYWTLYTVTSTDSLFANDEHILIENMFSLIFSLSFLVLIAYLVYRIEEMRSRTV